MPLIQVHNVATRQTPSHVYLTVTWPTLITSKTADVYSNDLYVKVYNAPHLFEFDLAHPIDDANATCTIDDDQRTLVLALPKVNAGTEWDTVQFVPPGAEGMSRAERIRVLRDRRDDARARHLARQDEAKKQREKEKWEKQRYLVRQQMDVEKAEREKLESAKKLERETAENAVFDWVETAKSERSILQGTGQPSIDNQPQPAGPDRSLATKSHICDDESSDEDDEEILALRAKYKQIKLHQDQGLPIPAQIDPTTNQQEAEIPTPRQRGEIQIKFTPRQFVSAARETQDAKWAAQMEEARRRQRPANAEAVKLEEKAIKLQSDGQWLLAVDAYSALLAMTPKNHRAFVGRSECYANLKYVDLAAADAQAALALIEEMEKEHEITGVYDTVKAQLRLRIDAAVASGRKKLDSDADQQDEEAIAPLHAAG
ncbi:hypothetical protein BCR44DRAFT_1512221 [Catenaria anguillulae PL171]|uniref:CS domain-containing protein n=1 Tax=Catenaria anguillulae PL171 TaxID=765915 RepID=A0A1Y2HQA4_9FUNG|nr:hypothetical protein BCR44DRAFT_1512221 [Catenaria anguillulae PL171]